MALLAAGCAGVGESSTSSASKTGEALYPDVVAATAVETAPGTWRFDVTISSPYDSRERYADAFRVVGTDGTVYGSRELTHDHANEQPFTRTLEGVGIPADVGMVVVEGHDLVNGWGGAGFEVALSREGGGEVSQLTMTVEGVDPGRPIPVQYTCDGSDLLPAVTISSVPDGTAQLALIVDDPDAPRQDPFVHWVVYGIDASAREITDDQPELLHGVNDAGSDRWSGPCPPPGEPHTYHWRLFALGKKLDLPAGLDGRELEQVIGPEVIASTEFIATYERGG
ncbi:MAG: YbhB/YbcL family Raf kinase inhibitor-like protein [Acidimicrobiia bacterium]